MSERLIQIVLRKEHVRAVTHCLSGLPTEHWFLLPTEDGEREVIIAALHRVDTQEVLDAISSALEGKTGWRLHALPTEASLPDTPDEDEQERVAQRESALAREEIYADIRQQTALTLDYLVLTVLATIVAAIGLAQDQTAVVIGAMVIAPLLGPILAFAFAVTLGLVPLMLIALRTLGAGLALAVLAAVGLSLVMPGELDPVTASYAEPLSLMTVALPLASGAAAALMVAGGQTSALVGVMVAAALLPPLSAFGLLLGGAQWGPALKALATVVVNIAAINLAAQVVFRLKGIRPRRWKSERHQTSLWVSLGASAAIVALLALAVYAANHGWMRIGR
jgi:uncharacterized hydrophobic protein (TIGR00341 family)